MNPNTQIKPAIISQVKEHLLEIERKHDVVILHAIESGSRAWGFPSPDSDYDVRFIYRHHRDWYLRLNEARDVIELPINDELDIGGWDVRKAFQLANRGNAVIQEWLNSPIVYQQSSAYNELAQMINGAFNPAAAYHHYRAMAKKAHFDIEHSEQKKLKRFFYFARATLSAKWVLDKATMPSIVFSDLINSLMLEADMVLTMTNLVEQKSEESEQSLLAVPSSLYQWFVDTFESLDETASFGKPMNIISNDDFRAFVNHCD